MAGRPTTAPLSAFGEQLMRWLHALGVSQAELARRAKVDVSSITHWTRVNRAGNDREPGYTKVKALADALHITVDQLINGTPGDAHEMTLRDAEVRVILAYRGRKKFKKVVDSELENGT